MNPRTNRRLAALALAGTAGALLTAVLVFGGPLGARQTPAPPAATPLVTGKFLTPQGRQTEVGSFPANLLRSPDGRFVVATNVGSRQYLSVLSTDDGRLVSQVAFNAPRTDVRNKKQGLFWGLAWGKTADGGVTLYASRGSDEKVSVLTLARDGTLTNTGRTLDNPSGLPPTVQPNHVAGIALSSNGARLYAANNILSPLAGLQSSVSVLDTTAGKPVGSIVTPGYPFAVAAVTRGPLADKKVFVSSEQMGTVSVLDPSTLSATAAIPTGAQPTALLLDAGQRRLFVANAGSDTVSVVDVATNRVARTILLRPDNARGLPGATPTSLALSPDEKRLYVSLADMNAVAVVDLDRGSVAGYVPVGWYPTSVAVSPDGKRLLVANAKGTSRRNPNDKPITGPNNEDRGRYIMGILEGTVSLVDVPADAQTLARLTTQTLANNLSPRAARPLNLVNPGIRHVLYIIKENRTYDQVLGDVERGNGDKSLCLFGREVTPNLHALAERFVLLDNFYCCAEVSGDGWNWSTSGQASEYAARNVTYGYGGRVRQYDYEGTNTGVPVDLVGLPDVAAAPGGYLWDLCAKNNVSYRNYGCFADVGLPPGTKLPAGTTFPANPTANKKALNDAHTDPDFCPFDLSYADSDAWVVHNLPNAPRQITAFGAHNDPSRLSAWKREFDAFVKNGNLPRLSLLRLGRDHTSGTTTGASSPRAMVADNDYAVGQIVEAVSRSPYWKNTVICVVEDDAQNGYDHVDAHRSIAFVISPWIKKGTVDSRFYNTDSMLRTIESLLGLPPMNAYDAIAAPLAVFGTTAGNDAPYTALLPAREIIGEVNGKAAYRAADSARLLNPRREESAPDEELNDILWHAIKGRSVPAPPRRYSPRLRPKGTDKD